MKSKYFLLIQIYQMIIINTTKIIQNCKKYQIINAPNYSNQLSVLCDLCEQGYTLNADQSQCQAQSQILMRNLQGTYQCLDGSTFKDNEKLCDYCTGTNNSDNCLICNSTCQATKCAASDLYYRVLGQCLYYCGGGLLAYSAASCATSKTCQDGLVWSYTYQSCVYPGCGGNIILKKDQTQCSTSQFCLDGYYWSQSNGCITCSQQKFYKNIMKQKEQEDDQEEIIKDEYDGNQNQLEKKDSKEIFIENSSAQNIVAKETFPHIVRGGVQDIFVRRQSTQNMIVDKKIQTNNLVNIEVIQRNYEIQNIEAQEGDTKNQDISPNNINVEIDYN
ncbi:hypothetical protein ABPG74_022139 [Tetrahymena malaccensis]